MTILSWASHLSISSISCSSYALLCISGTWYLQTTFPRLPCNWVILRFWPMRSSGWRLDGMKRGEDRIFLPPSLHFGKCLWWCLCLFLSNSSFLHGPGFPWGAAVNSHRDSPGSWALVTPPLNWQWLLLLWISKSTPCPLPFQLFQHLFNQLPVLNALNSFSCELFPDSEKQRLQIFWYTSSKTKDIFLSTSTPLSLKKITNNLSNII